MKIENETFRIPISIIVMNMALQHVPTLLYGSIRAVSFSLLFFCHLSRMHIWIDYSKLQATSVLLVHVITNDCYYYYYYFR